MTSRAYELGRVDPSATSKALSADLRIHASVAVACALANRQAVRRERCKCEPLAHARA
jgi:hypothetical protein